MSTLKKTIKLTCTIGYFLSSELKNIPELVRTSLLTPWENDVDKKLVHIKQLKTFMQSKPVDSKSACKKSKEKKHKDHIPVERGKHQT